MLATGPLSAKLCHLAETFGCVTGTECVGSYESSDVSEHNQTDNAAMFYFVGRDGFRQREALGHLGFRATYRCDQCGYLSEKRESVPLVCAVPPQKYIFCCVNFCSTTALDLQQKLKVFLHSSAEQMAWRSFLRIYSSFV